MNQQFVTRGIRLLAWMYETEKVWVQFYNNFSQIFLKIPYNPETIFNQSITI